MLRELRTRVSADPKRWLSPEEVAVYLGISRSRVYQYVREGTMPGHYLPDSSLIRLDRNELDNWVRSGHRATDELTTNTMRRLLK
ncbi:helix-turn-helix domain-containing protein [candidate division KSB1 bacterium]|nr:helix-turn-helix domain-containing protein [candidate division KSB1 bacterium]